MSISILPPVHPGEILLKDFLEPMDLTLNQLARGMSVSPAAVHALVDGAKPVTPEMALRLGRYFNTSAEFWMSLQTRYELEQARDRIGDLIELEVDSPSSLL